METETPAAPNSIDHEFDDTQPAPAVVEPAREDPPPELVEAVRRHYAHMRDDLLCRILVIEELLGFMEVSGDLAERVAKLERFCGVKA